MAIHAGQTPCDKAAIRSADCAAPAAASAGPWILGATIIGSSMAFIDGTVVNVALPAIQRELGASVSQVQWVVESYALVLAALILVGGSLGDHYGRKRIYALGIALFAASSVWCGLAPTATQLIIARGVQGIGGALLVPGSLAIIGASFDDARRGQAIGTWSGFTAITTAIGPVLGGVLVEYLSWRWAFFINVPLAIVTLALVFWRVPESRDESAEGGLDWAGALLATLGLAGFVFGMIEQANYGWTHPLTLLGLIGGSAAMVAFVVVEARSPHPMMPLHLFRNPTFSGANLLTLILYAALGGAMFFLPLNLIQLQGYGEAAAGMAFLPFIALMFLLSRWSGGLVDRFGAKLPLVIGPVIVAAGFALFAMTGIGGSYWTTFFPAIVVMGLGMAISVPPLTTAVMSSASQRYSGVASGVNNAVSRTASLLAIAVLTIFVVGAFNGSLDSALPDLGLDAGATAALDEQRELLGAAEAPEGLDASTTAAVDAAIDAAFLAGYRRVNWLAAGLALASAVAAAIMIEGKPRAARSGEAVAASEG